MLFKFRNRSLDCDGRTYVVGILNVTPDSFSDGSKYLSRKLAVRHALEMLDAGADIIDIGGESTRPGSEPVKTADEIRRVIPVVCELRKRRSTAIISVDTMKCEVAEKALDAGADIINDVSALRNSQDMGEVIARYKAGVILMHMRGSPKTMQSDLKYRNLIGEINTFLADAIRRALDEGIRHENIMVDPGIGFGKNVEQNIRIISEIRRFRKHRRPILVGPSRKNFIGQILGGVSAEERDSGTAGAVAYLAMQGVEFVRVHDVKGIVQMLKVISALSRI